MILPKEQIDRYVRQTIIPEIGEAGQKKLLESSVFVCGENVREISALTMYLAAMGIGNICCSLKDIHGYDDLFSNSIGLNSDVKIRLAHDDRSEAHIRVFLGTGTFVKKAVKACRDTGLKFIPSIISVTNQWRAVLKTFTDCRSLTDFMETLNSDKKDNFSVSFMSDMSGALCSVEAVKLCLNMGKTNDGLLLYDLFNMEFAAYESNEIEKAMEYFYRADEKSDNEIFGKLSEAKVLIVGAGGLGSPVALALAAAGVGTLGVVDSDCVKASNLNRQVLHAISRIGMPKAESAKISLEKINPQITVNTYGEYLSRENAADIIETYDLVISAVDNIQTRYLLNDACYFMNKPLIEAGVLRFDGTATTIIPHEGHCYRCIYPNVNSGVMSCVKAGILGAVPGIIGFVQAAEAYKVIVRAGTTLKNKILLYDGLEMEFDVINIEKNPECPLCGKNPTIKELQDYTVTCEIDEV